MLKISFMFVYTIEDNVAYINYLKDRLITSVVIPRLIDGCIVKIPGTVFEGCSNLEYINGVKIKEGVNIINNIYICIVRRELSKYLRDEGIHLVDMLFGEIKHNINSDYIFDVNGHTWYVIDGLEYKRNFNERFIK